MAKRLVLAAVLAGCSSKPAPQHAAPPAQAPSAFAGPEITRFVTAQVTTAMRIDAAMAPPIQYVSSWLTSPPTCWTKLVGAMTTIHQLEIAGQGSYFLFEGDLPRANVESCATTALPEVRVSHDGDLTVFESGALGTIYAAWRGATVIVGSKAHVTAAIAPHPVSLASQWKERLAMLPAGLLAIWRNDALFGHLFGVPTTSYVIAITRAGKDPQPFFVGQFVTHYATPEQASLAAQRIHAGDLSAAVLAPPQLVAAFQRMQVTTAETTVTVDFDHEDFAGVDIELLRDWVVRWQQAAP